MPACWTTLGSAAIVRLVAAGLSRREIVEALVGVSKAVHAVACVLVACDRRDLGTAIGDARGTGERSGGWFEQPAGRSGTSSVGAGGQALDLEELERFEPTLFLHETVPGGNGFSPLLFEQHRLLIDEARRVVEGCGCSGGCPACVGPPLEVGERCREHAGLVLTELAAALTGDGS